MFAGRSEVMCATFQESNLPMASFEAVTVWDRTEDRLRKSTEFGKAPQCWTAWRCELSRDLELAFTRVISLRCGTLVGGEHALTSMVA